MLYSDIILQVRSMPHAARLRKVGGSVMLAIPKPMLDALDLTADASVDLSIAGGRIVVDPRKRKRYSLDELLAECKPSARRSREDRDWLAGGPVGREARLVERGEIWLVSALTRPRAMSSRADDPSSWSHRASSTASLGLRITLPITTKGRFARTAGFAVSLGGAGTRTVGVVRCDQPRALDMRARGAQKLESAPGASSMILAKVATLFE